MDNPDVFSIRICLEHGDGFVLKPIGFVRHSYSDEDLRRSPHGVDASIEILPEFAEGLEGLEGFSHIIVVSFLHKSDRKLLKVKPRRLRRFGIPEDELPVVGVFSTDSPLRPNPIAVSVVRLLSVEGRFLHISGCDLFNGTPVLDIKPVTGDKAPRDVVFPRWYLDLVERVRSISGVELDHI